MLQIDVVTRLLPCFRYRQQRLPRRARLPLPSVAHMRAGGQGRLQCGTPGQIPARHAEPLGGNRAARRLRQGARLCRLPPLHTTRCRQRFGGRNNAISL